MVMNAEHVSAQLKFIPLNCDVGNFVIAAAQKNFLSGTQQQHGRKS
jgi:hypothetical protein